MQVVAVILSDPGPHREHFRDGVVKRRISGAYVFSPPQYLLPEKLGTVRTPFSEVFPRSLKILSIDSALTVICG